MSRNPLLESAVGSTVLRAILLTVGYLAAREVPYFPAIMLALLLVGWQAERISLNSWHQYRKQQEDSDG